jgi:F0F1-type ATP synthase assembly protein I
MGAGDIIILICATLFTILAIAILSTQKGEFWSIIWGGIAIILSILLFSCCFYGYGMNEGYKKGQIDAATGHQNYHFVTYVDSVKSWELKQNK